MIIICLECCILLYEVGRHSWWTMETGGWSHTASWHSDIILSSWQDSWIPGIVLPSGFMTTIRWVNDGRLLIISDSQCPGGQSLQSPLLKYSINSKYFWIENSWCTGRDLWLHHYVSTINSFVLLSGEGGFGYKIGWNLVIRSRKSENSRSVLESPHACIPGLGTMCEMLITALHRVTPDRHITLGTQLLQQLILPWATWLASLDSKWPNPGHCIQYWTYS